MYTISSPKSCCCASARGGVVLDFNLQSIGNRHANSINKRTTYTPLMYSRIFIYRASLHVRDFLFFSDLDNAAYLCSAENVKIRDEHV